MKCPMLGSDDRELKKIKTGPFLTKIERNGEGSSIAGSNKWKNNHWEASCLSLYSLRSLQIQISSYIPMYFM